MFFAGRSEAIPHLQAIASSQTPLLAMTSAEVLFRVQHDFALIRSVDSLTKIYTYRRIIAAR